MSKFEGKVRTYGFLVKLLANSGSFWLISLDDEKNNFYRIQPKIHFLPEIWTKTKNPKVSQNFSIKIV